jgi:rhodanese-related sulfurtransferase
MKEITVQDFKLKSDNKENFQLIDVREPHEYETANLGGELIPMGTVLSHLDRIAKDKPVIIHCKSGARSGAIVNELEKRGYTNVYNLKGGILAYAREYDPTLAY